MRAQVVTTGTVLARTDFQEADRIITVLTPDNGKLRLIAKGARRPKSRLAGGIELFSLSNINFIPGRGDISTLVSARIISHYGSIVKDIKRTMLGYELLKRLNRATEDATGEEYFRLLCNALEGLNDLELASELTELWFSMQLLQIAGHAPNLRTDADGAKLNAASQYLFDHDAMAFRLHQTGLFNANHIKLLRLAQGVTSPLVLKKLKDSTEAAAASLKLINSLLRAHVRVD